MSPLSPSSPPHEARRLAERTQERIEGRNDLVFDKRTGELDARIQRLIGTLQRKIALGEIRAVRTYTLWAPGRCGVQLRLASDELFTIVEGASFPGVKRDATQLADRLATFLGAPREDN